MCDDDEYDATTRLLYAALRHDRPVWTLVLPSLVALWDHDCDPDMNAAGMIDLLKTAGVIDDADIVKARGSFSREAVMERARQSVARGLL